MPLFAIQSDERTASTALGYRAGVKIGGKDKDRFLPSINTSFGRSRNDEFFINVRADDKVKITGQEKIIIADDLTEIETPGRRDRMILTPDGKLDYQIDLLERPENPWIDLIIKCSSNLSFHHQPELTPDEIADGCERDENRINGYDIYCDKRNNEYQTGMVGWIERSWVEGGSKRQWTTQNVNVKDGSGTWRIDIPPDVYGAWPSGGITIGPILGYDTYGSSSTSTGSAATYRAFASPDTMPATEGTITAAHLYITANSLTPDNYPRLGVYAGTPITTSTLINSAVADTYDSGTGKISVALTGTLAASTVHWLAFQHREPSRTVNYRYSALGIDAYSDESNGDAMPEPFEIDDTRDRFYSCWLEYTAAGGLNFAAVDGIDADNLAAVNGIPKASIARIINI